ncbi:MAG: N-acetyltransferase, partial [Rhodocyclaceae bacterium]|nr:N-acetyltransferase [Rhodocyclaceae bacterium]
EGLVLANNHRMLKFARQLGFSVQHCPGDASTVHIERAL